MAPQVYSCLLQDMNASQMCASSAIDCRIAFASMLVKTAAGCAAGVEQRSCRSAATGMPLLLPASQHGTTWEL